MQSPDIKKTLKITGALVSALLIATVVGNVFFIPETPKINEMFIKSFPNKVNTLTGSIILKLIAMRVPSPTITPIPLNNIIPSPAPNSVQPSIINQNNYSITKPTIMPTKILLAITPTEIPPTTQPTKTVQPTPTKPAYPTASVVGCPKTSNLLYNSMRAERSSGDLIFGNPETSPEINLRMRGFGPNNKSTGFISRNGSTYGLDDKQPPQISSLFGGPRPQIVKTYSVYEWDFDSNKSSAPNPASPNYEVTMIGLGATPGQQLVGLQAGREIGGGNVFMVLYATDKDIVFTHSNSDTLMGGYLFFFLDICVDPNLLTKYNQDNNGGRSQLPVIAPGQIFGYAGNTDTKVVVRDTMSFMDTRYNEDWWDYK